MLLTCCFSLHTGIFRSFCEILLLTSNTEKLVNPLESIFHSVLAALSLFYLMPNRRLSTISEVFFFSLHSNHEEYNLPVSQNSQKRMISCCKSLVKFRLRTCKALYFCLQAFCNSRQLLIWLVVWVSQAVMMIRCNHTRDIFFQTHFWVFLERLLEIEKTRQNRVIFGLICRLCKQEDKLRHHQ